MSWPYNPRMQAFWFGLFRFRSPLLTESILFLFLWLLRCFTSPGVALLRYVFTRELYEINRIGLLHSEILGSQRAYRSPRLIAVFHVLHRLLAPRHSSYALCSLINCSLILLRVVKARSTFRRLSIKLYLPELLTGHRLLIDDLLKDSVNLLYL